MVHWVSIVMHTAARNFKSSCLFSSKCKNDYQFPGILSLEGLSFCCLFPLVLYWHKCFEVNWTFCWMTGCFSCAEPHLVLPQWYVETWKYQYHETNPQQMWRLAYDLCCLLLPLWKRFCKVMTGRQLCVLHIDVKHCWKFENSCVRNWQS